ncbi:uncharacterized protein MKK02DRAFT_38720 [Dioszegia hungarica]|uniref:G-patch domain-containing protein n=1 Tax=Dioszegia hungarica TaxID=4972 RepID=A0AA38LSY9_9TREE|nr:uncharacterized protein MKK02DRAFT_38720 [Dioszegia hungarica]KAI9634048.1 hypothetical protein MKK02DRAFT_38720 [Dioszegia hungarica]
MTAPSRVYRAGLGLPPAVTITSAPYPPLANPLPAPSSPDQSEVAPDFLSGANAIIAQPRNRYPQGYPSYAHWKEWHINPAHHGPEGSTGPPVFVPSQLKYDELGRSILHGFDAEVDTGAEDREGREDGEKVAEWYDSLAGRSRGVSVSEEGGNAEAGPSKPRARSPGPVIDLTGDDEDEDIVLPSQPAMGAAQAPIRVHRNEWFIRRALASSASAAPTPPRPAVTSSISSLLNIPTRVNRATEPVYALGPDHIGHQILRERLGWGGGGLGRPEGWEPPAPPARVVEERQAEGSRADAIVIEDSDDSAPSGEDEDEEDLPPTVFGPGRTAPIATTLKLDRLGLGHRLSADRPKRKSGGKAMLKEGEGRKKVTHSHEEILEAQRRARYSRSGAVKQAGGAEELGKKGKIRWKERDKKDRDERRRMIAALND